MHEPTLVHETSRRTTTTSRSSSSDHPFPPTGRGSGSTGRQVGGRALLVPFQIFLAAGWFRAGVEKTIDPLWWSGAKLDEFLALQRPHMMVFFAPFVDHVVAPLSVAVAVVVVEAQLAIAICLAVNQYVRHALWAGIVLNLSFTMAGRVNPSAFYLVMELALMFAIARPTETAAAFRRAGFWLVGAVAVAPFARTVDPALVIDDPAVMISFLALLASISTLLPHRHEIRGRVIAAPIGHRIHRRLVVAFSADPQ